MQPPCARNSQDRVDGDRSGTYSASMSTRQVLDVRRTHDAHWVGDGFPVRTVFFYGDLGAELSPFLMLDYTGPHSFEPTTERRGVGPHPHRGFETVTIVYSGEVEHRDSSGAGGTIGPGDVQWMTAGAGIVHEEFHAPSFAERGGRFELVQLWVNLPARHKTAPPRYQSITSDEIPSVPVANGQGRVRIIAGTLAGARGPAETFTRVNVWDLSLAGGAHAELSVCDGDTAAVVVLTGELRINGSHVARDADLVRFDRSGTELHIDATSDTKALVLSGQPIDEPIVGYGPFVMNSSEEIRQATLDFRDGRMGRLD